MFIYEEKIKQKEEKPKAKLIGENGNVYNLLAICKEALREEDEGTFEELTQRVFSCQSYDESLNLMSLYVDIY